MKKALVSYAGGIIDGHLINCLKQKENWLCGVCKIENEFGNSWTDEFIIGDLIKPEIITKVNANGLHEGYLLTTDLSGAGFVFNAIKCTEIINNSFLTNLNVPVEITHNCAKRAFYCTPVSKQPAYDQISTHNPTCSENTDYPSSPNWEYCLEKLFITGKNITIINILGSTEVCGRNSSTGFIKEKLGWA